MIVKRPKDLPKFDDEEPLVVDVETTSFDDKVPALNPFKGHRICGTAVCTVDGKNSWYVPMRHSESPENNIHLEIAKRWLKDVIESGRTIIGHNVKFDCANLHFDDCHPKGKIIDTMIMARLWKSDLLNLSLDYLTGGAKDKKVKAYLKTIKSKDYGRCPIEIMGPYAENDALEEAKLFRRLRKDMRSECMNVWDTEIRLTPHLLKAEINGIRINWELLKRTYRELLKRMLILQEEIDEMAGTDVDCLSSDALNDVLTGHMGFEPIRFTDKGNPQWNAATLEQLEHPIGRLIKEYSSLSHFTTTYCEGWIKRKGDDDRLHTNFKQAAATTGRMASEDPCVTNMPPEAELFVMPDDDCAIGGGDYSQIEYRIFAHYANDESIITKYNEDPKADYHKMLADMLGVPRPFAKSLNFSFIYGMGKSTLLTTIAGIVAMNQEDENMRNKLWSFGLKSGRDMAKTAKTMDLKMFKDISIGIYNTYHELVPSVKQLQSRVMNVIQARGWLKNYKGRVYTVPSKAAYKGVNFLIQGSAADIFKERLLNILDEMPHLQLITNVYDSLFFSMPKASLRDDFEKMVKIAEDCDLRVPIKLTTCVGLNNLNTCVEFEKLGEIEKSMEVSKTKEPNFTRNIIRISDIHKASFKEALG